MVQLIENQYEKTNIYTRTKRLYMTDIIKICKKHGELTKEFVYLKYNRCKLCHSDRYKKNYLMNREKIIKRSQEYYKKNKSKIIKYASNYQIIWRSKNHNKVKLQRNNRGKKDIKLLRDHYLKKLIYNSSSFLKFKDIDVRLLEIKRICLLLKRTIKERKNDNI